MRELLTYSKENVVEEKITLRIKADNSGNIYLPTAGYSPEGVQGCAYDWKVSIDGGIEVNYSGVGNSSSSVRVGYGLNPLSVHTVTVKPEVEEYGWLRAFGYKGTDKASSLINIISDKSYKGYAVSEIFTGDWYKAYQYYGCVNLINTDEELLPDTLEIIGDNYRYYEYAGCISLVGNAEEKILKTVRVIGDNYRAYQYQNCTGINRINMRAINWASVGNNYRLNQYSGIGTDRNLVNIYIEGGIEEGGSWGLVDSNVKGVYVYKDLVNDYKTKLSGITSSKIQKNSLWDNLEYEFIEYIGLADSTGKIRIPVGGYSTSGNQDCAYDWLVSVDGGEAEEITGTGSDIYVSVGSGLIEGSEHRVIIKPATIGWGWGRAFGYYNTGAEGYIKELIHDSYKCYASNRIETGDYYKYQTYYGCTSLINSYEKLPTSVTTVGDYYMKNCYMGCTSLEEAFWEVMHKGCSLGSDYRYQEYKNCSSLGLHKGMAGYSGEYPTNYKLNYFEGVGDDLDLYITRKEILSGNVVATKDSAGVGTYTLFTVVTDGHYKFSGYVNNMSSSGSTSYQVYNNGVEIGGGVNLEVSSEYFEFEFDASVGDVITFKVSLSSYGSGNCTDLKIVRVYNSLGLESNRLNKIYCFVNDIYDYQNSANWSVLKDKLTGWYYPYKTHTAIDIDRYTELVTSVDLRVHSYNVSPDWDLIGQISVSKKNGFPAIMLNAIGETGSRDYAFLFSYTISPNNLNSINTEGGDKIFSVSSQYNKRYASGDWDVMGNLYSAYTLLNSQGYNFNNVSESSSQEGIENFVTKVSRNGQFIFTYFNGYKRFIANKIPGTSFKRESAGTSVVGNLNYSLFFSDDGLTVYKANNDNTALKQYTLTMPRDLSTASDSGKSLSIDGGYYDMSSDGKYLFKYKAGTIYQYTYE